MPDYTCKLTINAPVSDVYAALTTQQGVAGWWTTDCDVQGHVGGKAVTRFGRSWMVFTVETLEPNRRVVWKCTDQHAHKSMNMPPEEWIGTRLIWDLTDNGGSSTAVVFTHEGLNEALLCHEMCCGGWDHMMKGSFVGYTESGEGKPDRPILTYGPTLARGQSNT